MSEKNQEMHYAGKSLIWLGRVEGLADSHKKNEAIDIYSTRPENPQCPGNKT